MDAVTWDLIRDERLSLVRMAAGLSEEQWTTRTLCTEWTVHDVVAHLTMTSQGEPRVLPMLGALAKAKGHLWHAGRDIARDYARRSPHELLTMLERDASARTKPVFVINENILLDLVVHGQDIAVPLGIDRPVPAAAAAEALERAWSMGWPFRARRRLAGVRLVCVDPGTTWEAGSGPDVLGSAGALALLMTGRTDAAIPMLRGQGVSALQLAR